LASKAERPLTDRPTVAIETHGCKLNQADSSRLGRQFIEAGYRLVSADEPADVHVVNTCTVTHVADRKARQGLRAVRRRNPDATIVATGCYSERAPLDLRAIEEVDLVVGNTGKATLVRQVMEWRGRPPPPRAVPADGEGSNPRIVRHRAMVKIQEGCDQVCAYCIVPRVRGRERSLAPDEVVEEVGRNVVAGCKEVVLTGTQLGSYGFDLPDMDLTGLLERIVAETDVARLRISSLQPQDVDRRLLDLWSDRRLCPHFHLPLQSGSDAVLRRMRRRYTASAYTEAVERVREAIPDVSITTDIIVGFPEETEEEFEETRALCERVGFANLHVFPYSARPGTSAARYGGKVSARVKSRRTQTLLALAKTQAAEFGRRLVGQVRPVLWENAREVGGSTVWSGLTDNYVRVLGHADRDLANQITPARLSMPAKGRLHADIPLDQARAERDALRGEASLPGV
jgi:threonylcarbamoyladenosine tRNA methylthiotransferase MtaB